MGAFVTTLFLAWGALVIVLGARGAFIHDPGAPPLGLLIGLVAPLSRLSRRIFREPGAAGICPISRPALHCGDTGVEMGGLRISDFVYLSSLTWNLRLAGRTGRYGDRRDGSFVLMVLFAGRDLLEAAASWHGILLAFWTLLWL